MAPCKEKILATTTSIAKQGWCGPVQYGGAGKAAGKVPVKLCFSANERETTEKEEQTDRDWS